MAQGSLTDAQKDLVWNVCSRLSVRVYRRPYYGSNTGILVTSPCGGCQCGSKTELPWDSLYEIVEGLVPGMLLAAGFTYSLTHSGEGSSGVLMKGGKKRYATSGWARVAEVLSALYNASGLGRREDNFYINDQGCFCLVSNKFHFSPEDQHGRFDTVYYDEGHDSVFNRSSEKLTQVPASSVPERVREQFEQRWLPNEHCREKAAKLLITDWRDFEAKQAPAVEQASPPRRWLATSTRTSVGGKVTHVPTIIDQDGKNHMMDVAGARHDRRAAAEEALVWMRRILCGEATLEQFARPHGCAVG